MVGKAEYLAKCECDLERHQETIEKLELMVVCALAAAIVSLFLAVIVAIAVSHSITGGTVLMSFVIVILLVILKATLEG